MRIRTVVATVVALAAMTLPVAVPASASGPALAPDRHPGAPRAVHDLTSSPTTDGTVVLDWVPAARGPKATSYLIRLTYVQPGKTFTIGATSTVPTYTIGLPDMKFLTANTTMTASVRAVNAQGRSAPTRVGVTLPAT